MISATTPSHCSLLSHTHYLSPTEVSLADGTKDEGGEATGFVTGFDPLPESLYLYHSAVKGDKFVIPLMHAGKKLTNETDYGVINLETNIVSIRGKYSSSGTTLPGAKDSDEI